MRRDDPGPYSIDSLRARAAPVIFTTDAEALKARYVAWFEAAAKRTLYPMQVEMLLIEALAYAMSLLGHEGQIAVQEGLVATASEAGLLALGPNRATPRLPASAASTTLRFSAEAGHAATILVPAGTRVSAGSGGPVFMTARDAVIAPGFAYVDVSAHAMEAGGAADGLAIETIATMLDPIAGVSAGNIVASSGGADEEDIEAYRLRLANAFERISAGSYAWYRETAMGVSPAIVDVAVVRPQPCYIDLYVLTRDGGAGASLLDEVMARFATPEALDQRYGDLVTIKPSTRVEAAAILTVRYRGVGAALLEPQARAAAEAVLADWRSRHGADVAPSEVEAAVRALPGVVDAELAGVAWQKIGVASYMDATLAVVMAPV